MMDAALACEDAERRQNRVQRSTAAMIYFEEPSGFIEPMTSRPTHWFMCCHVLNDCATGESWRAKCWHWGQLRTHCSI